jgi:hypothetical protein
MSGVEDVHRRLRISNLEARSELHEIEIAALTREIASPLTSPERRAQATARRDAALAELSGIKTRLDEMRKAFPSMDRTRYS